MAMDTTFKDQKDKVVGKIKPVWSGGAKLESLQSTHPNGLPMDKAAAAINKRKRAGATSGGGPLKAVLLILAGLVGLMFIASLAPILSPKHFEQDKSGVSEKLQKQKPLPQVALGGLFLALLAALFVLTKKKPAALPPNVTVGPDGLTLLGADGQPVPRGFKLSADKATIVTAAGHALPAGCALGAGGVLLHTASGRPIPHSVSVGEGGELLSSTGMSLPQSMSVGPNCTLVSAEGVVMSPDLQEVPPGFKISSCTRYLLRPNGKPVPRGVHVGPGFRLLKPSGETLPDGVKIGPCGTIICLDDSILGPDGAPLPEGFKLTGDKTQIIDPEGNVIDDDVHMGPNGTVISKDDVLLTAVGKAPLPKHFTLGPLGELLMKGNPVPSSAYWNTNGQLVSAAGSILAHLK